MFLLVTVVQFIPCLRRSLLLPSKCLFAVEGTLPWNDFCLPRAFAIVCPLPLTVLCLLQAFNCCRKSFDIEGPLATRGLCHRSALAIAIAITTTLERRLPSKGLGRRRIFLIERPWPSNLERPLALPSKDPCPFHRIPTAIERPFPSKGLCRRMTLPLHPGNFAFKVLFPLPSKAVCVCHRMAFAVEGSLPSKELLSLKGLSPQGALACAFVGPLN